MASCSQCGTSLRDGARFCKKCGASAPPPLPAAKSKRPPRLPQQPPLLPQKKSGQKPSLPAVIQNLPGSLQKWLIGILSGFIAVTINDWAAGTMEIGLGQKFFLFVVAILSSFLSSRLGLRKSIPLVGLVLGLLLLPVQRSLAQTSDPQPRPEHFLPGAKWRLKKGYPKPTKDLEWQLSQDSSIAKFGNGQITARSSDGVICTFSFSPPPSTLVVGKTYPLSLQGLGTTHQGHPHRVINVTISASTELRSLQNPNHYRVPSNRSVYVYPPPARKDMSPEMFPDYGGGPITAAHSEQVAFDFVPQIQSTPEFTLYYIYSGSDYNGILGWMYVYEPGDSQGPPLIPGLIPALFFPPVFNVLVNGRPVSRRQGRPTEQEGDEPPVNYTLDIRTEDERTSLAADGEDRLWLYAKITCDKAGVDTDSLTSAISFSFGGGQYAGWMEIKSTQSHSGYKAVLLACTPPVPDAEIAEDASVLVTVAGMSADGDSIEGTVTIELIPDFDLSFEILS